MLTTFSSTEPPAVCPACGGPIEDDIRKSAQWAAARWPSFKRFLALTTCRACIPPDDTDSSVITDSERLTQRVARSGLPDALRGVLLADLDPSEGRGEIVLALNGWAQEGGGVFLTGPVGTGKTRMAAAAAWARLQHGWVRWATVPALTVAYQAAFDDDARKEAMRTLTGKGALVLDDLGHERTTEDVRAQLHAAVDARVAHGAPLLITSNFTPSELGEQYGDWLASRIAGYCKSFRVLGRDRRLDRHATPRSQEP